MTEMVTGVDLIAEQIRAAQGEVLSYKQEDIQLKVRPPHPSMASIAASISRALASEQLCPSSGLLLCFAQAAAGMLHECFVHRCAMSLSTTLKPMEGVRSNCQGETA